MYCSQWYVSCLIALPNDATVDKYSVERVSSASSDLIVPSKNLSVALLNSIGDTKVIEQPLVRMPSIRMSLKAVFLLLALTPRALDAPVGAPPAPLRDTRHAELAGANLDVFAVQRGAGVCVQARELGRAGGGGRHSRRFLEAWQ